MKKSLFVLVLFFCLIISSNFIFSFQAIDFLRRVPEEYRIDQANSAYFDNKITEGNEFLQRMEAQPALYRNECREMQKLRKSKSEEFFFSKQREYLQQIIEASWAIYNKAVEKKQGFKRGTIVLIDPRYAFFNFLFNYGCFVNPRMGTGSVPRLISENLYAYPRISTHFPEQQLKNQKQYGIDIRFNDGDAQPLLPARKTHFLFGKLVHAQMPLMFIKFEPFGLSYRKSEMVKHLGKAIEKTEKDITGKHIAHLSRREDVPKEVISRINALKSKLTKTEKKLISKRPFINYISSWYQEAKRLSEQGQPYSLQAKRLVHFLEGKYDHLDIRRGNEVIIDLSVFAPKKKGKH